MAFLVMGAAFVVVLLLALAPGMKLLHTVRFVDGPRRSTVSTPRLGDIRAAGA